MIVRVLVMALVAAACAGSADVDKQPNSNVRAPMDTIGTLREVCEVLTRDRLSPAAAREALGQSSIAWVRAGRVIADAGAAEPDYVEFALPSAITTDALARAFGDGHPAPRLHPHDAPEVLYYPVPLEGRQHACALIARFAGDGASTILVRRDPRL